MGNQVTAHNTINSVRTDIVTETKTLKNCFQELFANMKCKATSQANISGEIDEIVNYLKKTENNLCSAQQAATALAGVNRKVAEKTISINVFSAVSGIASMHPIDINPDGANQALGGFRGCAQKLELKIDILNRCKKEISALPESEQNISSVSTIDSIFAGLVGGIKSAVTKVKTVKQQCVSGLKNAVSNLQKAITCIRDIGSENGRYAKLIAEFAACDANIINRYKISRYSDVLMRTRQYNDGNVPAENDLQNEITNVGGTAGSIATVTCESCKELDEEVTRLDDLYKSNYGGAYNKETLIKMEQNHIRVDTYNDMDRYLRYRNADGTLIGYYIPEWGCTWYAAARYRAVNGVDNDLRFSERGGNADNWVNSIDKRLFEVSSTNDSSVVKPNTIAVSTQADPDLNRLGNHASENHVCYVEGVHDGYVYYSEGSWGKSESTYGYIQKMTVEDFCKDYEYIISAK